MKDVALIHLKEGEEEEMVHFLGHAVRIRRVGSGGHPARAQALIKQLDGTVDAIGLEGMPAFLELGTAQRVHEAGQMLSTVATRTPVVDGGGVRAALERWGVILADRAQPGIFSQKRVLMVPGLNHTGLAQALARRTPYIRYADPVVYFALPQFPGVGTRQTLQQAAPPTLEQLQDAPFRRIRPQPGQPGTPRSDTPFHWADVLAGDVGAIRRYAPPSLKRKTIVVEAANEEDLDDLRSRGAAIAVTMMPALNEGRELGRWSAATVEAVLVALRAAGAPLTEDTYLDLLADIEWSPAIRYLQPAESGINRFAFVIHPLNLQFIHRHHAFRWTRYLPDLLVERLAAYAPPIYISRISGGRSPTTGQQIEGHLLSLSATPREMMRRDERFTYTRLNRAARMAERLGARIMGLGAFTSVVGDAGITVAHEADIAITSGNSLTVAATLEAAKQAVIRMGREDLTTGKVMIIYDIGLPPGVAYACLAETALLAMEGRFEDYTLGRRITMERVKEIYRLFKKHQFQIASLRSFDRMVTDEMVAEKRALAEKLRRDPILLAQTRREVGEKIATMPIAAKGVSAEQEQRWFRPATVVAVLSVAGAILFARRK